MMNFVARMLASALFMFIIFFKFKDLDIDPSNKYHIYPTTCFDLVENLFTKYGRSWRKEANKNEDMTRRKCNLYMMHIWPSSLLHCLAYIWSSGDPPATHKGKEEIEFKQGLRRKRSYEEINDFF